MPKHIFRHPVTGAPHFPPLFHRLFPKAVENSPLSHTLFHRVWENDASGQAYCGKAVQKLLICHTFSTLEQGHQRKAEPRTERNNYCIKVLRGFGTLLTRRVPSVPLVPPYLTAPGSPWTFPRSLPGRRCPGPFVFPRCRWRTGWWSGHGRRSCRYWAGTYP